MVAEIPLVSWTGYKLNQKGIIQFNIDTLDPNELAMLNSAVDTVLAAVGFVG